MRRTFLGLLVLSVACAGSEPSAPVDPEVPNRSQEESKGPILVELFTSQGCSSCPPADRLLTLIGEGKFGDDVIPLAYHVDYWNYIGWRDPFSDKRWSSLQRGYSRKLRRGRVYTPMLVVDGRAHVVGSDVDAVEDEIEDARDRGRAVSLTVKRGAAKDGELVADVSWTEAKGAAIFVAVTESEANTDINRGENAGRELENDYIVRELVRVMAKDGERSGSVVIPTKPGWNRKHLKLVAFARDSSSMAILGAARE